MCGRHRLLVDTDMGWRYMSVGHAGGIDILRGEDTFCWFVQEAQTVTCFIMNRRYILKQMCGGTDILCADSTYSFMCKQRRLFVFEP